MILHLAKYPTYRFGLSSIFTFFHISIPQIYSDLSHFKKSDHVNYFYLPMFNSEQVLSDHDDLLEALKNPMLAVLFVSLTETKIAICLRSWDRSLFFVFASSHFLPWIFFQGNITL